MRTLILISISLFIISCTTPPVVSEFVYESVYWVDPDGNDNNDGTTPETAWATWGKAFNASVLKGGDTVIFKGGVYYKNIKTESGTHFYPGVAEGGTGYAVTRDGSKGNPLVYMAYPPDLAAGNPPILDNNNTRNPLSSLSFGIVLYTLIMSSSMVYRCVTSDRWPQTNGLKGGVFMEEGWKLKTVKYTMCMVPDLFLEGKPKTQPGQLTVMCIIALIHYHLRFQAMMGVDSDTFVTVRYIIMVVVLGIVVIKDFLMEHLCPETQNRQLIIPIAGLF
ncbi:MAG: hypothetical protein HC875_39265 [Anaerolineales bacterium]|nr:hypothetical protein [Anaerolineales bacterium]